MPLVRIRRQLLRHSGQGVLLADLKTAGSRRTLHLSQPLVDLLRVHRARQNAEEQAARIWRNPANLVFTSTIGPRSTPRPSVVRCRGSASGPAWGTGASTSCAIRAPHLLLAMGVPLEVVSDTLGHASIRVTMDVYGHLLAPSRMLAAEAMRRALWIDELPDFAPLATELATNRAKDDPGNGVIWDSVGFSGPPGSRSRHLGIKSPLLFRMS